MRGAVLAEFAHNIVRLTGGSGELGVVLRGGGLVLAIRSIAAALSYLSLLFLARWLGAAEFGLYTYAFAWLSILALPAGLGFPPLCVRFLPSYAASGDWARARGLIARALQLTAGSAALLAALAAGVLFLAEVKLDPAFRVPLIAAVAGLPVMTWVGLFAQIGRSFGWPGIAYAPSQVVHPLLLLAFLWLAAGVVELDAATAIRISLAGFLVVLLLQLAVYAVRLSGRLRAAQPRYETAAWLAVALPLVLFDGFAVLIAQLDLVLLGVWMPPYDVGAYAAAARIAVLVNFCFDAAVSLAGPRFAALHAQQEPLELRRLVRGILPWTAIPALGVAALLVVLGDPLLGLFGPGFEVARPALIVLTFGYLASVFVGPVAVLLNMTGHHAQCARTLAGAALLNVALNLALIPRFGLVGAATATAIAIFLSRLRLLRLVRTRLALEPSVWGLMRKAGPRSD